MRLWKCERCGLFTLLTKHHVTPIKVIYLCRWCHNEIHGMQQPNIKYNKKYVKGTKRMHKKK